jgi:DNA-binding NtrC family response regulator
VEVRHAEETEEQTMGEMSVLLVDDEKDFLEVLAKRLRKRKLILVVANSGEEAIRAIQSTAIDVVVLDMRMPGMDGLQTLREIKQINPLVEVIMLTGHANVETAVKGMELGAFDYLIKPVDIDELLYKLQDAFKKKAMSEPGPERTGLAND